MATGPGTLQHLFDLFLKDRGFTATTIGFLISFGSICEIVVFLFIAGWFQRFSERLLIVFALGITVVRWVMLANLEQSFASALLIQGMHALTFGVVHSVAIHRVGRLFPQSAGVWSGPVCLDGHGRRADLR